MGRKQPNPPPNSQVPRPAPPRYPSGTRQPVFVRVEISGVQFYEWVDTAHAVAVPCNDPQATCFGVYLVDSDGAAKHVSDHATLENARACATVFNLPVWERTE